MYGFDDQKAEDWIQIIHLYGQKTTLLQRVDYSP